jgi:serine/threonine-protein kinase RsbW
MKITAGYWLMETDKIFKMEIPGRMESIPRILCFLSEAMEYFGMDEDGVFDVNVAVDEACANIINYSCALTQSCAFDYSCGSREIEVTASRRGGLFFITVANRGEYFDPTRPVAPDISSDIDERKVGGLGVYLIQQLMDELRYEYKDGIGTLTMGKRLPESTPV